MSSGPAAEVEGTEPVATDMPTNTDGPAPGRPMTAGSRRFTTFGDATGRAVFTPGFSQSRAFPTREPD